MVVVILKVQVMEVIAVVVNGTEPGENECAFLEFADEVSRMQETIEGETLSLYENLPDPGEIWKTEVASITRKEDGIRVGGQRTSLRLEPSDEEFIEASETLRRIGELRRIEAKLPDKRVDELAAGWVGHAASIPAGKEGSFD